MCTTLTSQTSPVRGEVYKTSSPRQSSFPHFMPRLVFNQPSTTVSVMLILLPDSLKSTLPNGLVAKGSVPDVFEEDALCGHYQLQCDGTIVLKAA